jgi:ribosomal protein S10
MDEEKLNELLQNYQRLIHPFDSFETEHSIREQARKLCGSNEQVDRLVMEDMAMPLFTRVDAMRSYYKNHDNIDNDTKLNIELIESIITPIMSSAKAPTHTERGEAIRSVHKYSQHGDKYVIDIFLRVIDRYRA